jgi:hypothetical protein
MRLVRLMLVSLLTVACGPSLAWYRPNTTQQEWHRDRYECRREVAQVSPPGSTPVPPMIGRDVTSQFVWGYQVGQVRQAEDEREDLFESCMQARGYRLVPKGYRP